MSEIDMIPREYRANRRMRRHLRLFLAAALLVSLAGAGAGVLMKRRVAQGEVQLAQLRSASALAQSGNAAIDAARAHKAMVAQALATLAALRGAGDAVRVADAIEAALAPELSLDQVSFSGDTQQLAPSAAPAGQLVLPAVPGGAGAEAWQLSRRLEISGVAAGYPALTGFLGRLSAQPGLVQVRLVRSGGAAAAAGPQPAGARPDAGVQFTVTAALERLP